jgi:hypothetical protein
VTATFQTLPGASCITNGAALASDSALTTASAELRWLAGWSVAGTFEGEFSDVTRSYTSKGVVRYNWYGASIALRPHKQGANSLPVGRARTRSRC